MIEEQARVVNTEEGKVLVETQRSSTCGQCSAKSGCGSHVLQKVLGKKRNYFYVKSNLPVDVGDLVIIGLHESALVRGSMTVYLLPIIGFIFFGLLGELIGAQLSFSNSDNFSVIAAFVGLVLAGVWIRYYSGTLINNPKYQPNLLRRFGEISVKSVN